MDAADSSADRWLDPTARLGSLGLDPAAAKITLKVKYWKEPRTLTDPKAITLMYEQIQHHLVAGTWQASEGQTLLLGSYHIQAMFGDFVSTETTVSYLDDIELDEFLPPWLIKVMPKSYYEMRLARLHERLAGKFADESAARAQFIEVARQLPSFGLTMYMVSSKRGRALQIGVAEDGLFVLVPSRSRVGSSSANASAVTELERFIPYTRLVAWRASPTGTSFELECKSQGRTVGAEDDVLESGVERITFHASRTVVDSILGLITAYYRLLLHGGLLGEERAAREAELDVDWAAYEQALPAPTVFNPPARRKLTWSIFPSRLEVFKHMLMQVFRTEGLAPVVKLWHDADLAIDTNRWIGTLELYQAGLTSATLKGVMTAMVQTFSFESASGELVENFNVEHLLLGSNAVDKVGTPHLGSALTSPSLMRLRLRTLDLSDNASMSNKGVIALAASLVMLPFLADLLLAGCDISHKGATALFEALAGHGTLERLVLARNKIADDRGWGQPLKAMLQHSQALTELDFSSNKISDSGLDALLGGLMLSASLVHLDVSDNKFSSKVGKNLAMYLLAPSVKIRSIAVGACKLSADVSAEFGRVLAVNTQLTCLNFAGTSFGKGGPLAVLDVLPASRSLVQLDLSGTGLDSKSMSSLAAAILGNATITDLNLADNKLGSGKLALKAALAKNKVLARLDLSNNGLKSSDVDDLAGSLERNATLKVLILDGNSYGNHGLEHMCRALQANRGLLTLSMARSKVGDKGLVLLPAAFSNNKFLHNLVLDGNSITDSGLRYVLDALSRNNTLATLSLEGNSLRDTTAFAADVADMTTVIYV